MLERTRQHLLADAVTAAERAVSGLRISAEVIVGFPIGTLYDESRRAQLLVLGSRGLGGLTGLLVGSVAVGLAAQAGCPVVVVRGEDRDALSPRPVVVGVDGSPNSEAAVAFAFEAAAAREVPLVAVHSWADMVLDPQIAALIDWVALERGSASRAVGSARGVGREVSRGAGHPGRGRDGAATALVEQSKNAQLVVVGSRGRGNFTGAVLGSVSHAVLHHSHCPVAVVRPDTASTLDD